MVYNEIVMFAVQNCFPFRNMADFAEMGTFDSVEA